MLTKRMMKHIVRYVQQYCNQQLGHNIAVDGICGPQTINCIYPVIFDRNCDSAILKMFQFIARANGIDVGGIDGVFGVRTLYAYDVLIEGIDGGLDNVVATLDLLTFDEKLELFGTPGKNLTYVHCPYPLYAAWDNSIKITKFLAHRNVAERIESALDQIKQEYQDEIALLRLDQWGGCFNYRNKVGGSSLSAHAWGIAIDWDPLNNRLHSDHTNASFAAPRYNQWWKIWNEHGFIGLGQARDYDWMHIEATR